MLSYSSSEADVATAVTELCNLFQHVPEEQQELVCSSSGGIRALVVSTSSRSGNSCCKRNSVQLAAAKALGSLAAISEAYQGAIAASGGVRLLVQLMGGVNHAVEVQEAAAAALVNLTMGAAADGIAATVAAGGVRAIVQLLQLPGFQPDVGLQAVRVLANLSMGPPQYRSSSSPGGEAGGADSSQGLAAALQEGCAGLLESLATRYPSNCLAIEAAGGVRLLQQLVRAAGAVAAGGGADAGSAAGVKEAAVSALKRLGAVIPQC
eukprot:gene11311-11461_t